MLTLDPAFAAKSRTELLPSFHGQCLLSITLVNSSSSLLSCEPYQVTERTNSFAALDREMEKRHDLVKEKREADNAQTLAHASGMRNEVQVMGTSPIGTMHLSALLEVERRCACDFRGVRRSGLFDIPFLSWGRSQ